MEQDIAKDGGYKSRKLIFGIYTGLAIIVTAWLCPATVLPEVVAGLVAVYSVFVTGNAFIKNSIAKNVVTKVTPAPKPKEEPVDPEGGI